MRRQHMSATEVAKHLTDCYRNRNGRGETELLEQLVASGWKDLGSGVEGTGKERWYFRLSLENPRGRRYEFTYDYPTLGDPDDYDPEFECRQVKK